MIPLKDNNPTRNIPVATIAIIAINVLVFLYELALGDRLNLFIASWGTTPYEIVHNVDLVNPVRYGQTIIYHMPGPSPIYLTILSSMFMHAGFVHIAGNMLYLWIFGNNIEDIMGPFRFVIFYLICGVGASLAHILSGPNSQIPSIGASGAIAGVLGAYLLLFPRARVLTLLFLGYFIRLVEIPALYVLGFWIIIQFFSGILSLTASVEQGGGVAWFAHIGGFVVGLALVRLFQKQEPYHENFRY